MPQFDLVPLEQAMVTTGRQAVIPRKNLRVKKVADFGGAVEDGNGGHQAVVESLRAELADYHDQLMAKDRQLENKDQQIQQLQVMLDEAQTPSHHETALLHEDGDAAPGKSWWRRLQLRL